jgi:predicted small lipoprotein YifL
MNRFALILLVALALAGCSQAGPQAPLPDAQKINTMTGDISTACGLFTQLNAFPPPPHHEVVALRTSAASALRQLAAIDHAHPQWRFDGVAMPKILEQAHAMLRDCGLT